MNCYKKVRNFGLRLLGAVGFILLAVYNVSDSAQFLANEKFIYDLTWMGIKAGKAQLEWIDDGDKVKIVSTAKSADWVSVFYTVDDRVESSLFKSSYSSIGQPLNYRIRLREGRHRKNKEVVFDHKSGKVTYIDHLKNKMKEFNLPAFVFDPLSSFFYVRTMKLRVGESVFITIFDSKKVWDVEIQVLRREKISLPIGTFNTIVIKPLMKSEGIFYRKGDIFIWLTDDEKRIPVKVQTKVPVGSINATLVHGIY